MRGTPRLLLLLLRLDAASSAFTVQGSVYSSSDLNGASGFAISGSLLYTALSNQHGLSIVNIASPSNPSVLGTYTHSTYLYSARDVVKSPTSNYVYMASYSYARLTVIDVSSSSNPTFKSSLSTSYLSGAVRLALSPSDSSVLFVAAYSASRFTAVDVSNPASVSVLGSISGCPSAASSCLSSDNLLYTVQGFTVVGSRAFVVSYSYARFVVIGVANPAAMTILGSVQVRRFSSFTSSLPSPPLPFPPLPSPTGHDTAQRRHQRRRQRQLRLRGLPHRQRDCSRGCEHLSITDGRGDCDQLIRPLPANGRLHLRIKPLRRQLLRCEWASAAEPLPSLLAPHPSH